MNNWDGIGRVTKKIECTYTAKTHLAVARFTLAIDRDGKEKVTDFIPCEVLGKQAETMASNVDKGEKIAVYGALHSDSYKNKAGDMVYTLGVYVRRFEFIESKAYKDAKRQELEHAHENAEISTESTTENTVNEQQEIPDGYEAVDEDVPF